MNVTKRPLSPHLQIYKPQLTSVLSITHRLTGFALCMVILISPVILYFLTMSRETHAFIIGVFQNGFAKLIISLALFGMVYHLCNGIRHLAWDAGYGLDLDGWFGVQHIHITTVCSIWIWIWIRLRWLV